MMTTWRAVIGVLAMMTTSGGAVAAPVSPGGWTSDASECASGGPTHHFFADGTVIKLDCGEDCPNVYEGSWKALDDGSLALDYTRRWYGAGSRPAEGPVGARTIFEVYTAKVETISERETLPALDPADSGCEVLKRHGAATGDVRAYLRNAMKPTFPMLSERELTREELAELDVDAGMLEIMRNEIYARYGVTFQNKRLRAEFSAREGYVAYYDNVSAFLSPIERKNVATLLAAEKAKKAE